MSDDPCIAGSNEELKAEIIKLRNENRTLKETIAKSSSKKVSSADGEDLVENDRKNEIPSESERLQQVEKLSSQQIERYSRQLILNGGFGVNGQLKLLSSSVLVVGAGGIGSSVILYLAAMGVGRITIVDYDNIETCNLHRQIIHRSNNVGMNKALSAKKSIEELNPSIQCNIIQQVLDQNNVIQIFTPHDCIVDASDNPKTRYLINDACVLLNKPLVSGSAIGVEGQLSVYNYKNGPCYRCLYPKKLNINDSIKDNAKTCSDNGVFGPVPGLIGILQSIETMKVLTGTGSAMHDRLLMYDSLQSSFLNLKKPPKRKNDCPVCGINPTIRSISDSYHNIKNIMGPKCDTSCGITIPKPLLDKTNQISCTSFEKCIRREKIAHILLDVRVKEQYELCSLNESINIPLKHLTESKEVENRLVEEIKKICKTFSSQDKNGDCKPTIYCICRRGFFSHQAVNILLKQQQQLKQQSEHSNDKESNDNNFEFPLLSIKNVIGGLDAWRIEVDPTFPVY